MKILYKNKVCGCIFSSHSSLNFYKQFKNLKKKIIYSSAKKTKLRRKNFKKKFIIGVCANISPVKNIIFFLKIAETLKKYKNIEFKILGNYWESPKTYFYECLNFKKKRNLNNVNFIVNSKNYEKKFSEFDVYLCTSVRESCPVSIIEAMEKKIPIISTDVGDVKKILNLNKNKCGDVVELNLQSFCKKILKYKNNNQYYKKISNACHKNYRKNFTVENYNMKFTKFLSYVNKNFK